MEETEFSLIFSPRKLSPANFFFQAAISFLNKTSSSTLTFQERITVRYARVRTENCKKCKCFPIPYESENPGKLMNI